MRHLQLILVAVLSALPLTLPAAEPESKAVAFTASVRVDVDATGKPLKVEAPADLPDAIRDYIEKRVATWQYQPATQDGVAVAATTYVAGNACAVPVEGGYRLGLDFENNGMRYAGDQQVPSPRYPNRGFPPDHRRHSYRNTSNTVRCTTTK